MNPIEVSGDAFRRVMGRATELAAEYLEDMDARKIFPEVTGEESRQLFGSAVPEQGIGDDAFASVADVMRLSRVQNGRFFGYVLGSGEPVGAAADLIASVLNQNVTAWRSGPAAVAIEQTVIAWLAQVIGCGEFRGHLTGGGSSANLMGLAMARESKAASNEKGIAPGLVVYASDEVHMSIPKAAALLGIGRQNVHHIGTDSSFRMVPELLERSMLRDKNDGKVPVAVVASAGTVKTGAIDPLPEIAEIAQANGAWFHIDGAYGALAAIAEREKFQGMELADSISLDPHKWLYQPLDCGCLLYRSAQAAQDTFSHTGDYARSLNADPIEGFAFFEESLELSRRFRALKLWLSLRYHGLAAFRDSIRKDLAQAQRLADRIRQEPQLELLAPVTLSAVCFRHCGTGEITDQALNSFNTALLKRIIERGRIYVSNALIHGKFCLRACIVNHRTTESDIDSVVPEVLAAAREV